MEHTKGSWSFERPSRIMLDAGNQRYAIYSGTELKPEWICEIHFSKHDIINKGLEENTANARLIAAAPDLLEALEEMMSVYPAGGKGATEDRNRAVEKSRAAIKLAKGL